MFTNTSNILEETGLATMTCEQTSLTHESNGNASEEEIRWDLVNRMRAEIATGTYDTPEKLELAVERLLSVEFE